MYQTSRSQRIHWGTKRLELQKLNRAKNIKAIVQQDNSIKVKGFTKIQKLNFFFRAKAIQRAKDLKLIN